MMKVGERVGLLRPVPETTCDFYPNNPNNLSKWQ